VRVRSREFAVSYGDSVRVEGDWRAAEAGSADVFERRLLGWGVCGEFRAKAGGLRRLDGAGGSWITRRIFAPAHDRIRQALSRGLGSNQGFPIAVFLGETGYLDRRSGDAFKTLGITHLIALSGQHLCFISGAVVIVLRVVRRRSSALLLLAISLYVGVVGFIVSLWRSFVMVLVLAVAGALKRPLDPIDVLAKAFVIVVLFFPNTYYSVGFQLSFLATLALLVSVRGLRPEPCRSAISRAWFWIRSTVEVGVAAQLAVTPVLIHYFGSVSVLAPIATLVFVFPVAFVLLLSGFAASAATLVPAAGPVIFPVLDRSVSILERSVVAAAKLSPETCSPPPPEPHVYYAALALLAFSGGRKRRKIAGWLLLVISFAAGALRAQLF
jgi:competence protein ComEC